MDSDDDYQSFLPAEEEYSSPVRQTKLKRLKKSASVTSQPINKNQFDISSPEKNLDFIQPVDPSPSLLGSEGFNQGRDSIKTLDTMDSVDSFPSALESEGFDQEGDLIKTLGITDSVDPEGYTQEGVSIKNPNAMESVDPVQPVLGSEGFEQGGDSIDVEDGFGDSLDAGTEKFVVKESDLINELRAETGIVKTDKRSEKKRRSPSEGVEETKEKTKKKKKNEKDAAARELPKAPAPTKKRLEKERKIHLEQLHAETQRLLRESRDAEFKPVPIVQKPISSILAKIRQRKLEVSKKASSLNIYFADSNDSLEVNKLDYSDKHAQSAVRGEEKRLEEFQDKDVPSVYEKNNHLDAVNVDTFSDPAFSSFQHENSAANMVLDKGSKSEYVTPQKDAQDVLLGLQPRDMEDGKDEESKSTCPIMHQDTSLGSQPRDDEDTPAESPVEEVIAPSLQTMESQFDAAQPNDTSSDEEESDKENVEPDSRKLDDLDLDMDTKGDPVKAFLDDEAEEEDDSDEDSRSKDEEDEEDNELNEELKDLIAYGYQEKPVDNEKRDQLHQMWLQQQDAAETDNVLQRLKCGAKQKGPSMLEEEEDEEDEDGEPGDDFSNDLGDHESSKNMVRMISKKAKQMIPQMFTDKDDAFLSSDDEETDQKIVRQRLLEKAEEDSSLLPPAEDENSREVFDLIKKLNTAPDTKKKAKPSSILDAYITGGNSNSSSRFSFLGRASSNSLPVSSKHVSSNVRSFIFGRDDSNSRSGISTSEVSLDTGELEKRAPRNASAKFSGSQTKCSTQSTVVTETSRTGSSSSSSLLEVLRRSSSFQSDHHTHTKDVNMVGQTQARFQFAAFKPGKKSLKVEGRT
ncbi:hypothetical protein C5167_010738 [Papaver somniferum]|uniref:DNA replication checkpoint mediator MRC1 domain-containing protein n=1 Tax=Papaver somniferum TaxID=3469 RepID=A0A4Y7K138_PAPSO|nr:uncharacterized protein LOC113289264 [Papaver somniferum]RZC67044.1 hypothetical protein C5167_010738 [Papaver somniferum]